MYPSLLYWVVKKVCFVKGVNNVYMVHVYSYGYDTYNCVQFFNTYGEALKNSHKVMSSFVSNGYEPKDFDVLFNFDEELCLLYRLIKKEEDNPTWDSGVEISVRFVVMGQEYEF